MAKRNRKAYRYDPFDFDEVKRIDVAKGVQVKVEWKVDDDPDLSFLDHSDDNYVESTARDLLANGFKTKHGKPYTSKGAMMAARYWARLDQERLEAFERGDWCMMGVIASVLLPDGEKVAMASCWGFESDGDSDYLKEAEQDEIEDALSNIQSKIDLLAERHSETAAKLRAIKIG